MCNFFYAVVMSVLLSVFMPNAYAGTYTNTHKGSFAKYLNIVKYDTYFKKYTKHYFGAASGIGWLYFKSQAIAESALNTNAKSYVGAEGLMQVMPATYSEIKRKDTSIAGDVREPRWGIAAGIYYDSQLFFKWRPKKTQNDRLAFMFASYNAGMGNIIKAQARASCDDEWVCVAPALASVTGKLSAQTTDYVFKIFNIYDEATQGV